MLARCTSSLDLHMLIVPYWYLFRTLLVPKVALGHFVFAHFSFTAEPFSVFENVTVFRDSSGLGNPERVSLGFTCLCCVFHPSRGRWLRPR